MNYTFEKQKKKFFIGLELRTNNEECSTAMPAHKDKFFNENIPAKIPNRIDGNILALYTDYEGDYTKPYSWILGCEVSSLNEIPAGLVGKVIPESKYAIFTTQGEFPQGLNTAWQSVWKSNLSRAYTSDFELYRSDFNPHENPEVKVYIAIAIDQPTKSQPGRYKFYREHKYVSFALNDLERLIAKTDFQIPSQVKKIEQEFSTIVEMLRDHAHYEDSKLHALLREKGSALFQKIQGEHEQHDTVFQTLQELLNQIETTSDNVLRVELGYQFYLNYRKFVGDNLHHLHEEETLILPELQRLYTDAELRTVEAETYQQMTVEDLVQMMQILFPHFNYSDREAFLIDIKDAAPEKFIPAWNSIKEIIAPDEQKMLAKKLGI